jgi:hypothetical protein
VPCFRGGYEAAIVKIMQESIGVLDRTVGGIDHALEYVSDRLAELIFDGADIEAWQKLAEDTRVLVQQARDRIAAGVDPILDHASFSPMRAQAVLATVPKDAEARVERFVRSYANHTQLRLHARAAAVLAVEGAPGAAGDARMESGYNATFQREHALDHEEIEFLCFGHPLVQQSLAWASEAHDCSAALALCRGFERDGAGFLWIFEVDLPEDTPAARAYFDTALHTVALDETGKENQELLELLTDADRPLDRMDPTPLRGALDRWRQLVDHNFDAAEEIVNARIEQSAQAAQKALTARNEARRRELERALKRQQRDLEGDDALLAEALEAHEARLHALEDEGARIARALGHARGRLTAVMALRLMRTRAVSG